MRGGDDDSCPLSNERLGAGKTKAAATSGH